MGPWPVGQKQPVTQPHAALSAIDFNLGVFQRRVLHHINKTKLDNPLLEYCLKNGDLGDPIISKEHIYAFNWSSESEINEIDKLSLRIVDHVENMFSIYSYWDP